MTHEPHFMIEISIEIEPCYVRDLEMYSIFIQDFLVELGTIHEISFRDFTQVPACNYTSFYTATVEFKENGPSAPETKYKDEDDGAMVGEPPFVWIDTNRWKIVFDASDETLLDKTYQVYITKHILTNKRVQG